MGELYKECECPECGKIFYPEYLMNWGWKSPSGELVCSYHCQRKSEKKMPKKKNPQRKRIPVRIVETGETFDSISDCSIHLNTSGANIYRCVHLGRTHKGLHIERVVE